MGQAEAARVVESGVTELLRALCADSNFWDSDPRCPRPRLFGLNARFKVCAHTLIRASARAAAPTGIFAGCCVGYFGQSPPSCCGGRRCLRRAAKPAHSLTGSRRWVVVSRALPKDGF